MEAKLMNLVADDGNTYQAVVFKDSPTVSDEDAQTLIDTARAEAEAAKAAQAAAETAAAEAQAKLEGMEPIASYCTNHHFEATFTGDGGTYVTLDGCCFDPDYIAVRCSDGIDDYAIGENEKYILKYYYYDKRCTDAVAGVGTVLYLKSGANTTANTPCGNSEDNASKVTWNADTNSLILNGLVTSTYQATFGVGLTYRVLAVKCGSEEQV